MKYKVERREGERLVPVGEYPGPPEEAVRAADEQMRGLAACRNYAVRSSDQPTGEPQRYKVTDDVVITPVDIW